MALYVTVLRILDIYQKGNGEKIGLDSFQMDSMRCPCRCYSLFFRAIQAEPGPQRPLPAEAGMGESRFAYTHGCCRVVDLPAVRRSEKPIAFSSMVRTVISLSMCLPLRIAADIKIPYLRPLAHLRTGRLQ